MVGMWHVDDSWAGRPLCKRTLSPAYGALERLSTAEGVNPRPDEACLNCQHLSPTFAALVEQSMEG